MAKNVSLHIVFTFSYEKSSQKLVLRVSSGVPNTLKQEKHSDCGLLLPSVFQGLELQMKPLHSFLIYIIYYV